MSLPIKSIAFQKAVTNKNVHSFQETILDSNNVIYVKEFLDRQVLSMLAKQINFNMKH